MKRIQFALLSITPVSQPVAKAISGPVETPKNAVCDTPSGYDEIA